MAKKAATGNIHIRIPAKLKKEAEYIINALGLDTSSAIRLFYAQIVLQQSIPFTMPKVRVMSKKTMKIVEDAMKDETGLGPFDNAEEALKALYAAT